MNVRHTALAIALAASQPLHAQVIEEIIVTAQKRAENVMDVPIAITAYSGEMLEKLSMRNLTDLGRYTAGVDMNNDKALQPTYSIRGVETNDWTIGSDPAVAVYVDGVYAARGAGAEAAFVDVDHVEVLKGPQGTLFGRNATGGAIHIITRKPVFDTEARIQLTGGNYDRTEVEAMYNTSVGDALAVRVVGNLQKRDGYIDDVTGGSDVNENDQQNVRLALLWNATEKTEALFRIAFENMDQLAGVLTTLNGAAWEAANPGRRYHRFGGGAWDAPQQKEERDLFATSLEVNHTMDFATFTSITAWRDYETELLEDLDGSNNPEFYFGSSNPESSDFFSQEFRLTGATDRLKWTTGAVYTYEKLEHRTEANFLVTTFESFALKEGGYAPEDIPGIREANRNGEAPLTPLCKGLNCDGLAAAVFINDLTGGQYGIIPLLFTLQPRIEAGYAEPWNEFVDSEGNYSSGAVYGDATWSITADTNLTLGLRYTYDDKTFDLYTAYQNYLIEPGPGQPGVPFGLAFYNGGQPLLDTSESDTWGSLSGRLVLDHHFTDELMAYASIANGFKSGGFNSLNFGPGIDTSYDEEEVVNYEIGLKGSALEGTLNYSSALFYYEYENLQTLELVGSPIPSYNLRNADADGEGFEIELAWLPDEHWQFAGNYSYLKTEFTEYNIIPAAGETAADDLTGEPRAESPEHKYALSVQYTWPLADNGAVVALVDYNWTDDRVDATRGEVGDYGLLNARLSWLSRDQAWEVALWGSNLTDEEMMTLFGNGEAVGSTPGWRIPPLMWGVDVVWNL